MTEAKCGCGKEAAFIACAHVLAGEVQETSVSGNAASCGECSKLRPDDTFGPICGRCLKKLTREVEPEEKLGKRQERYDKKRAQYEALTAELHREEIELKALREQVAEDTMETLLEVLDAYFGNFVGDGHMVKEYEAPQALVAKLVDNDPGFPGTMAQALYSDTLDLKNPRVVFYRDLLMEGGFGRASLSETMAKAYKSKAAGNPIYAEKLK